MTVMTSEEFIEKAKLAASVPTLYIKGCFGAPMTDYNKKRYTNNNSYNKAPARKKLIEAADENTFGFDCVCLVKGILWGWKADTSQVYGGAAYKANGVPDFPVDPTKNSPGMMDYCTERSTDFSNIVPGEVLHNPGHAGIYIGDGLAIEATARWKDGVQITAVANLGNNKKVANSRTWQEHGKLQWVEYEKPSNLPTYELHIEQVRNGTSGPSTELCLDLLNTYFGTELSTLICDDNMVELIKDFQEENFLEADGIVGTKTWTALLGIKVVMDP